MKKIFYLYGINFLGGFLLFQIELIVSKILLPKLGGSYLVWSACVVFFQSALLAGYIYSHVVLKKFGIFRYRPFHLILIAAPLLIFLGHPFNNITANYRLPLVIDIFLKLSSIIGLAFFALATVSVITQRWLAESALPEHRNPYVLYGLSSAGSFTALVTYPFLFESFFGLNAQLKIWMGAYLVFVALYLVSLRSVKCIAPAGKKTEGLAVSLFAGDSARWFLLSAASSMTFLSVTNILTYEVAPFPLLWIIPLCIYLVSFALNFKQKPQTPSWIRDNAHLILAFSAGLFFITESRILPFLIYAVLYFISVFAVSMFCQYELYTSRPKEPGQLTAFYVIIAAGGVLGGIFVAWIAPLVFVSGPLEYLFGLALIPLALALKGRRRVFKPAELRWIVYLVLALVLWQSVFKTYAILGLIIIYFIFKSVFEKLKDRPLLVCLALISLTACSVFSLNMQSGKGQYVYGLRNYYGIYKVFVKDGLVFLYNGPIVHGSQFTAKAAKKEPLAYYHRDTPVGRLLESKAFDFKRIGIVGLGAGTLAAYGREGQEMDFFELDPDVYKIASACFDYLDDTAAKTNYIFGDARLAIRNTPPAAYDLIIVDAFSGNSVPVHLLTVEAIREYRAHLKKDGIILFHIGNAYLGLWPVLFGNGRMLDAHVCLGSNPYVNEAYLSSVWVAMTWDGNKAGILSSRLQWQREGAHLKFKKPVVWTDDYSNLASVFNIKSAFDELKNFKLFNW